MQRASVAALRTARAVQARPFHASASRQFDFTKFSDAVTSNEARLEVDSLRSMYADMKTKQAAEAKKVASIDWAKWEGSISRPGLVAAFKSAHQSIPTLTYTSPFTADLESGFTALISEAEQAAKDSEVAIAELEGKLEQLRAASDWENITFDAEMAANPTIKREIAQDLEGHKWFTV
jgi:hypothetical protein